MNFKRLFIIASVLILCCSGVSTQAAETETGAQASQAENDDQASETNAKQKKSGKTQLTVYTPQQLCCMAKYYYKKTGKDGFYPPEADCKEEQDGTYTIDLRELVEDGNGDSHYATYARYNVESNGKGEDTARTPSVSLRSSKKPEVLSTVRPADGTLSISAEWGRTTSCWKRWISIPEQDGILLKSPDIDP